MRKSPLILSVVSGRFPYETPAEDSAAYWMERCPPGTDREWIRNLYEKSGIATRHLAVPNFKKGAPTPAFGKIHDRLRLGQELARPLVLDVATRALETANKRPEDISQLVVVTSTLPASPGLDTVLMRGLGLRQDIACTPVTYAGCAAGVEGLRLAMQFYDTAMTQEESTSLVVSAEMCSIHTSPKPLTKGDLVEHALFSDGVAAAVVGGDRRTSVKRIALRDAASLLSDLPDGIMLRIDDDGIRCELSLELPACVERSSALLLSRMLMSHHLDRQQVLFFPIHPGGKKIIDAVCVGMHLSEQQCDDARFILRHHGNMISCGVFCVLERILARNMLPRHAFGFMPAFGPGVFAKGLLLQTT